jgi:mannose-6-phosphate isomerase-like protein (cupin superfamily)
MEGVMRRPIDVVVVVSVFVLALTAHTAAQAQTPARAAAQSQPSTLPAGDVTAAEIKSFIDALPKDAISDRPIRGFDVGSHRVTVYGVFRPKALAGDAILHETATSETYYMLEGTGTLVTGGTLADLIPPAAGATSTSVRGRKIAGGVSRRISPGDIVVIPGRTPHWWSTLDSDIRYLIIRSAPAPPSR